MGEYFIELHSFEKHRIDQNRDEPAQIYAPQTKILENETAGRACLFE